MSALASQQNERAILSSMHSSEAKCLVGFMSEYSAGNIVQVVYSDNAFSKTLICWPGRKRGGG
jgi:hypothetical protein